MNLEVAIKDSYARFGVDLFSMDFWGLKRKDWKPWVVQQELRHRRGRSEIVGRLKEGLGEQSVEAEVAELFSVAAIPLGRIFTEQLGVEESLAWGGRSPRAADEMEKCLRLPWRVFDRHPEYYEIVVTWLKLMDDDQPEELKADALKLQNIGFLLAQRGLPVILSVLGNFFSEGPEFEADARLILGHESSGQVQMIEVLHGIMDRLHPGMVNGQPSHLGGVWLMGAGWQVASPTSGESLDTRGYVLMSNLFKYEQMARRLFVDLGREVPRNIRKYMQALYIAHEYGHGFGRQGGYLEEAATDVPSVLAVLEAILERKPGFEDMNVDDFLVVCRGEYGGQVGYESHGLSTFESYPVASQMVLGAILNKGVTNVMGELEKLHAGLF